MNIAVLLKQTFDTEEKIKLAQGEIEVDGVKFIVNPYDEYAVEEAIRLRDIHGGKITVVSVGSERCAEALRTALAMGADEAVRIEPPTGIYDEAVISRLISAYLLRLSPDLILGGLFSVDQGSGQVAIRVAARLGIPHISAITKLTVSLDVTVTARAERDVEGTTETVEVQLPALFTAQQGLNEPRYPSLPGIMKAKKKPFHLYTADDLGIDSTQQTAATLVKEITLPPARKDGVILQGDLDGQIQQLAAVIKKQVKFE